MTVSFSRPLMHRSLFQFDSTFQLNNESPHSVKTSFHLSKWWSYYRGFVVTKKKWHLINAHDFLTLRNPVSATMTIECRVLDSVRHREKGKQSSLREQSKLQLSVFNALIVPETSRTHWNNHGYSWCTPGLIMLRHPTRIVWFLKCKTKMGKGELHVFKTRFVF